MENSKIIIIVPWFGKFPDYFEIFLRSVNSNPILHYRFYTDQKEPESYPNNVSFSHTSFESYCHLVSTKLNIQFHPDNPYKLCDLKPFLGFIHQDEIKDYEYWGFGDIDLILGNIGKIIDERLKNINFFTSHSNRVAGHFCFMKNNENFRNKCFFIKNWEFYLTRKENLGIDEGAFCDVICYPLGLVRRIWHRISKKQSYRIQWKLLLFLSNCAKPFIKKDLKFCELHSTHSAISSNILSYKWTESEWIYDGENIIGKNNKRKYPYLHFLFLKTVKEVPCSPTWGQNFYKVKDPKDKILITRTGIYNM